MARAIKINRLEAIRMIGAAIRTKTQEFERDKKALPARTERVRSAVLKAAERRVKDILRADSLEKLTILARSDLMQWKDTKDFPSPPELNVCRLKALLLQLQNDVRKSVMIGGDHELWSILNAKCEVIRG